MMGRVPPRGDVPTAPWARPAERPAGTLGPRLFHARYLLLERLGEGGAGEVWSAYDRELDRKIAVKLLHRTDKPSQARLLREAQAMARLKHDNVVTVYDVGLSEGRGFVTMELMDGGTLRAWMRTPHAWPEVIAAFAGAGRGLAAAHAAGLVHRDFKPDNILLARDGTPRVGDFGLARLE